MKLHCQLPETSSTERQNTGWDTWGTGIWRTRRCYEPGDTGVSKGGDSSTSTQFVSIGRKIIATRKKLVARFVSEIRIREHLPRCSAASRFEKINEEARHALIGVHVVSDCGSEPRQRISGGEARRSRKHRRNYASGCIIPLHTVARASAACRRGKVDGS